MIVYPYNSMLKDTLDRFYREYDFKKRLLYDPIEFPHRYKKKEDIEVSGFIASCLAYGRVGLFKPVIDRILSAMGDSPYLFLMDFDVKSHTKLFPFKYRFNESLDIVCLLHIIHQLLLRHASIEKAFLKYYRPEEQNIEGGLAGLVRESLSVDTSVVYGKNLHPAGLAQFLPSPEKGSACKRMNLFLRWMVRDSDIDFGIWRSVPKNKLVIPLDTHIARISRCLGFTKRNASDWKAAIEITEALKKFDKKDPLKYDFALCHHGISGLCDPGDKAGCMECVFS